MHANRAVSRRRPMFIAAAVLGALVVLFVLIWFQPQKLVQDQRVDEALPGSPIQPEDGGGSAKEDAKPDPATNLLAGGRFRALAHPVEGRARILEVAGSGTYLRLEDLTVENGPDLRVYLSAARPGSGSSYDAKFVDLGALKGNIGDQNYRIPSGTEVGDFPTAVIWCRRFSVGFAVAALESG